MKCELQLSRQALLAVFKGEIVAVCQDLSRDTEVLRAKTITNCQKLRHDVEDEIGKLGKDHADITADRLPWHRANDALEQIT